MKDSAKNNIMHPLCFISHQIIGVIFVNKEYSVIMLTERTEKSLGEALNSKSILFRKIFRGVKLFCVSNCKR